MDNRRIARAAACLGALGLLGSPALAQAPADLQDLVGARAGSAESELQRRGYEFVSATTGADRKWGNWWNRSSRQCVTVSTVEGRYDSIVSTLPADCRQTLRATNSNDDRGERDSPRRGQGDNVNLVCYGEGEKPSFSTQEGYEWDRDQRAYVPRTRVEQGTSDFSGAVMLQIHSGQGRIRLSKSLIPPVNTGGDRGWWELSDLRMSPREIRASYKLNGMNRPRVVINRNSGRIAIDGISKFSGTCDVVDRDSGRRF